MLEAAAPCNPLKLDTRPLPRMASAFAALLLSVY